MHELDPPVSTGDHVLGPEHAPITLLQDGDYECPESWKVYRLVESLRQCALQSQKSSAPSSLRLLDYPEGKIRAVERIMFPEGDYTKEHHMVPQEEVTEEWVKEQVTSFIQSVLERD